MLVEKSLPTFSCFQCEFSIFVPNEIKMSVPRSGRWNASAMIKVWINYTVNMFFIRRKVWIFLDRNVSLRLLGLILCLRNSSSWTCYWRYIWLMKILVTPRPGIISCNILLGSMFHCWYFGREKLWGGGGGGGGVSGYSFACFAYWQQLCLYGLCLPGSLNCIFPYPLLTKWCESWTETHTFCVYDLVCSVPPPPPPHDLYGWPGHEVSSKWPTAATHCLWYRQELELFKNLRTAPQGEWGWEWVHTLRGTLHRHWPTMTCWLISGGKRDDQPVAGYTTWTTSPDRHNGIALPGIPHWFHACWLHPISE